MREDNKLSGSEITQQELNLRIQILDYLFERGHRVTKPMIDDTARFTYDYGRALYEQGKLALEPLRNEDI